MEMGIVRIPPLKHQAEIIPIMEQATYLGLIWSLGCGKTYPILHLLEKYYLEDTVKLPSLIVCPSTLLYIWKEELLKFTSLPESKIGLLTGTKNQRITIIEKRLPINIINYEGLRVLKNILPLLEFEMICLDEAHRIKNHKAQQSKVAVTLKTRQRFLLTGTPILNSYLDVWNLAFFLDRGKTLYPNYFVFRNLYFEDKNVGKYRGNFPDWQIIKFRKQKLLAKIPKLFHRISKKDVLKDLPEKIYLKKYCYLTKINKKHYEDIRKQNITFFHEKAIVAPIALTKMLRLNQITSGFLKNVEGKTENLYHNPKLELLLEVVTEIINSDPSNKVIIWCLFIRDIENIINAISYLKSPGMEDIKIYKGIEILMGATPTRDRIEAIRKFQEEDTTRIFIGQIATASEGITLTKANHAIFYSIDYSLKNRLQAEARSHRKGSEIHNTITYIDLVMHQTIDEVILKKVDEKTDRLKEAVMYLKNKNIKYNHICGGL